jgi:hypothetical protein
MESFFALSDFKAPVSIFGALALAMNPVVLFLREQPPVPYWSTKITAK